MQVRSVLRKIWCLTRDCTIDTSSSVFTTTTCVYDLRMPLATANRSWVVLFKKEKREIVQLQLSGEFPLAKMISYKEVYRDIGGY